MIWLCNSLDICGSYWTIVQSLFWYPNEILDIYCCVRCPMWFNLNQHGHQCSLIWLNIAYLPNTHHSLILKIVLWKGFVHCQKGDPNWWLSRGSRHDFFNIGCRVWGRGGSGWWVGVGWGLGGGGGHLPTRMEILSRNAQSDLVMPLTAHLSPKLDCCTKPFLISGPNFGYILLGSCSNAAYFHSTWASLRLDLNEHC